jgi:SET domain-containing protein
MTKQKSATRRPNPWFRLRRSRIQGTGAFARVDIPKGTRIIEYVGEHITPAEADRRYPDDDRSSRHHTFLFTLNQRTVIDAAHQGNAARFINHSCDPNCDAVIERGHIWIYAIKDIPKGAELAYDYQFEHVPDYTEEDLALYLCRCGSANCRGTIVKVDRRRKLTRRWEAKRREAHHHAASRHASRTLHKS